MATTLPKIRFTLFRTSLMGLMTNTIMVDGHAQQTVQMGDTVDFEVPAGKHDIQLVLKARSIFTLFIPVTRKSNVLELTAGADSQPIVVGEYDRTWGKFKLHLG